MKNALVYNLKNTFRKSNLMTCMKIILILSIFEFIKKDTDYNFVYLIFTFFISLTLYNSNSLMEYAPKRYYLKNILSLPVTRRDYVISKFIIILIDIFAGLIITFVLTNIVSFVKTGQSYNISLEIIKLGLMINLTIIGIYAGLDLIFNGVFLKTAGYGGLLGFSGGFVRRALEKSASGNLNFNLFSAIMIYLLCGLVASYIFERRDI